MNLWEPNDFRNMKWSPAVKTPQISVLLVENHFIDDDFIAVPCLGTRRNCSWHNRTQSGFVSLGAI